VLMMVTRYGSKDRFHSNIVNDGVLGQAGIKLIYDTCEVKNPGNLFRNNNGRKAHITQL
jgi:hypothetical protein